MIYNKPVRLIAALDAANGIGNHGSMAWYLPAELKQFHATTARVDDDGKQNLIIVGRKTWESIPVSSLPKFANRMVVVLTRNQEYQLPIGPDGRTHALTASSVEEALTYAEEETIESVYVIGGGEVYNQFMQMPIVDELILTHLQRVYECDVHFPPIGQDSRFHMTHESPVQNENGIEYQFRTYRAA